MSRFNKPAKYKQIRLTDPYVIQMIEKTKEARGDRSSTRTAGALIIERITALQERNELKQEPQPQSAA